MSSTRQLAAIMFTDIVGYTALMGQDEEQAFRILQKNRAIQRPLIEQYGGRWIKELGDGVLASFNTVSAAVQAAINIQELCNKDKEFSLRIGIHQGEVIFEQDDIFGDAVNIASRIQALAPAGGIWISEAVHHNVFNKTEINSRFVGEEWLKNVREPVRIYEIVTRNEPASPQAVSTPESKPVQGQSIAVLPFVNMSSDPEQEYFSDGMTEEIINALNRLKDLKVAGRTSSFQFKGKQVDLREVGRQLGVSTVLEGSVRKQQHQLRITAQLINVDDGFHFWGERYDRTIDDVFAIQDEIALSIAEKLKLTLLEEDRKRITKASTQNTKAYELYLKGRFNINRRGRHILTGLAFLKQAIELDSTYVQALVGYADALFLAAFYNFFPGTKVMADIKQAVEKAIQLYPQFGEAYCSLATYYEFEWNWAQVKKNFLKSIDLNPRYAQAFAFIGLKYGWIEGNFAEAERYGRMAVRLEPLSAIDHADLAWTLHAAGKFEEALAMAETGIELDPHSFISHRIKALCCMELQQHDKAIETFQYLLNLSNRHQHAVNGLIWAYCMRGDREEAKALLNELEQRAVTEYIGGTYLGLSAACLGDMDKAFVYLEQACHDRDPILVQIKHSRYVPQALKSDFRFQQLLDKMQFPQG